MKTRGGNHIYLSMPHVIHVHEREIRVLDAIKGGERRRTCDEELRTGEGGPPRGAFRAHTVCSYLWSHARARRVASRE